MEEIKKLDLSCTLLILVPPQFGTEEFVANFKYQDEVSIFSLTSLLNDPPPEKSHLEVVITHSSTSVLYIKHEASIAFVPPKSRLQTVLSDPAYRHYINTCTSMTVLLCTESPISWYSRFIKNCFFAAEEGRKLPSIPNPGPSVAVQNDTFTVIRRPTHDEYVGNWLRGIQKETFVSKVHKPECQVMAWDVVALQPTNTSHTSHAARPHITSIVDNNLTTTGTLSSTVNVTSAEVQLVKCCISSDLHSYRDSQLEDGPSKDAFQQQCHLLTAAGLSVCASECMFTDSTGNKVSFSVSGNKQCYVRTITSNFYCRFDALLSYILYQRLQTHQFEIG